MAETKIHDFVNKIREKSSPTTIVLVLLFVILFFVLFYIYLAVKKREYNCKLIATYPSKMMDPISSEVLLLPLSKTTVKTAYNCCCTGSFKNDFVDICALNNCAKQGVRALDFTIYSLQGEPVIAASTITSKKYKEMYNHLPLSKTMNQIKQLFMYDSTNCTNIHDPLFLIFRIQSANLNLYNKIGDTLQSVFGYSNASGDKIYKNKSIETELIKNLMRKVIIFVDITGLTSFGKSSLASITSLQFGTMSNQIYRESEAYDTLESQIFPNEETINILYPDYSPESNNYDFNTVGLKQQFQFIGMNFQTNDVYLDGYNGYFKSSILKSTEKES
jgi:hypothetical protein